jgi:hypothetical protein
MPSMDKFIIGLTTDELACKQKRKPSMTYEHRREILLNLRIVDEVIPHTGDDKVTAWNKLHFTHVFIGDEYYGVNEYTNIAYQGIPVFYIPRHPNDHFSSSELAIASVLDSAKQLEIISTTGPGGPIMKLNANPVSVVIKSVRVSEKEYVCGDTSNVYQLPIPNPRNFKAVGAIHKYPNIPGVNSYRELAIQDVIKDRPWCSTLDVARVFRADSCTPVNAFSVDWSHLNRDKDTPREIHFIYQRYVGVTLGQWISDNEECDDFLQTLDTYIACVRQLCEELKEMGIVHGDLHCANICVGAAKAYTGPKPTTGELKTNGIEQLYLIDFGWCLHRSFVFNLREREYYEECLQSNWDWTHFCNAMRYTYQKRSWFEGLVQSQLCC